MLRFIRYPANTRKTSSRSLHSKPGAETSQASWYWAVPMEPPKWTLLTLSWALAGATVATATSPRIAAIVLPTFIQYPRFCCTDSLTHYNDLMPLDKSGVQAGGAAGKEKGRPRPPLSSHINA